MSLPYREKDDREFIAAMMDSKFNSPEETRQYLPPKMENGIVHTTLMVGATNTNTADTHSGNSAEDTESVVIECPEVAQVDDTVSVVIECPEVAKVEDTDPVEVECPEVVGDKDDEDREGNNGGELGIQKDVLEKGEAEGAPLDGSADREGKDENLIVQGIRQLGPESILA